MHLVLLTREDPPLPLARLRAHGRLVELRGDDLRYTRDEASAYLANADLALEAELVERLADRTEGWIAGLQLAAISLRDQPDAAALVDALAAGSRRAHDPSGLSGPTSLSQSAPLHPEWQSTRTLRRRSTSPSTRANPRAAR
jgi:hypothetical protein